MEKLISRSLVTRPCFCCPGRQECSTVYGTSFNVSAYREDANMITTLETGSVGLWVGEKEYRLVPGDQADVTVATGTVVKYR